MREVRGFFIGGALAVAVLALFFVPLFVLHI